MDKRYHFKRLVRIAKNAVEITPESFDILYNIAQCNGLDEDAVSRILTKKTKKIKLTNIDPWKRFRFFYSLVQLMRMDQPQYRRELNFCIDLAAWLGYDPVFLNKLILGIFHSADHEIHTPETVINKIAAG